MCTGHGYKQYRFVCAFVFQRLTEPKLKSLFSDLKIQDKEEIALKKFKSEGGDKEGLKEDNMRKKLIGIMSSYDLLEHFEDVHNKVKLQEHEVSALLNLCQVCSLELNRKCKFKLNKEPVHFY